MRKFSPSPPSCTDWRANLLCCAGGPRHEIVLPLDSDHRGICKFDDKDDPNYRTIHDHLLKVVDNLIGFSKQGAFALVIAERLLT